MSMINILYNKKILVGVTASIAIYKSLELIRLFIKSGAIVKVIMSEDAKKFISPLTFEAISQNKVLHQGSEDWSLDLNHIDTLSKRDYLSGLAEVIKCAIINDNDFFEYLQNNKDKILNKDLDTLIEVITTTINIKVKHVDGDLREGGQRLLLNYGHTLGHSIEISTAKDEYEQLRHGEGVSLGIIAASYIATNYLHIPSSIQSNYENILRSYQLPISISASKLGFNRISLIEQCCDNIKKDKKRLNNNIRLILSNQIGSAKVYSEVPFSLIKEAFEYVIKE